MVRALLPLKLIEKYFPGLSPEQQLQFYKLPALYQDWNVKINVISRKDMDHLEERHILHSLSIAKFISPGKGMKVLDVGTGGGFPGIPLAIVFPEVKFHLVDSVGKKIKVVEEIVKATKLKNVTAEKIRAEELKGSFDFIVTRAVAPLRTIYEWTQHLMVKDKASSSNARSAFPNGWICLKGGDLMKEIHDLALPVQQVPVSTWFEEEYFREKVIVAFRGNSF